MITDKPTIQIQIKNIFEVQLSHLLLLEVAERKQIPNSVWKSSILSKGYFIVPNFRDMSLPKTQIASVFTHLPIICTQ